MARRFMHPCSRLDAIELEYAANAFADAAGAERSQLVFFDVTPDDGCISVSISSLGHHQER